MGHKNEYNKAYDAGYTAGKEGNVLDDFAQSTKDIVVPLRSKTEDSYDAGYEDGASDRGSNSNSNYRGGSSEGSGGCFISTATMHNLKKRDNCPELTLFRNFRDGWLADQMDGKKLIEDYYRIAPSIVKMIDTQTNTNEIYTMIWTDYLSHCYNYIKVGKNAKAKKLYIEMVDHLTHKYIG